MRKRIAFVNQRYGLEVNGGSELLCRQMAERLSSIYDVEVITTCAVDYVTWANSYPAGESVINGVRVRRFPVEREREPKSFGSISAAVLGGKDYSRENEWIDAQGPYSPECVRWIKRHHSEYSAVIFMTYLYYLTAVTLSEPMENAVLLPTAHDEPPFHLPIYKKVFANAKAFIYLTEEEKKLCENKFGAKRVLSIVTGAGVEAPDKESLFDAKTRYGLGEYVLYVGRIDESKGCGMLFRYFAEFKRRNGYDGLKLALCGKAVMDIPKRDDILSLGFVTDEEKFSLIKNCKALIMASEFESLSMAVLEAMAYGRPVLVNGRCRVLKSHCVNSNAGLYFENYFEFEGALRYILTNESVCETMGKNGAAYVEKNYRWDVIVGKLTDLIEKFSSFI
ncbi:MAG: glycosyltransferase family 4 protein [Clostridia bacterium]|nr:glycosyltransferase family 4 protein [Clostridia bacterium]